MLKRYLMTFSLASTLAFTTCFPVAAHAETSRYRSYKHRAHRKTVKRVGVGAVGGAAIGALAGGGKGAAIGAAAGGGAGLLYDRHKKAEGRP